MAMRLETSGLATLGNSTITESSEKVNGRWRTMLMDLQKVKTCISYMAVWNHWLAYLSSV